MTVKSKAKPEKLLEDQVTDNTTDLEEGAETAGMENFSRTNMMSIMMKKMSGMSSDDLLSFFQKMMDSIGTESQAIPDGTADRNRASVAMKGAINEDLATVFGNDENLSEEFKDKMTTLFEAAVNSRTAIIEAELTEEYEARLNEELEEVTEGLVDQVDKYLEYVCENWIAENQVAIESSLRAEIAEEFMIGLKNLMQEHWVEIPDEKVDAVDMLANRIESLEEQLNKSMKNELTLSEHVEELSKQVMIKEESEGLSPTQKKKFRMLAEELDFEDPDKFAHKLGVIKEHHFSEKPQKRTASTQLITEEIAYSEENGRDIHVNPEVAEYFNAISRTAPKV